MNLFPDLKRRYTSEQLTAREAQRQAEFIAGGAVVFQASRLMLKFGIFEMLRDSEDGLTEAEVSEKAGLSRYAAKCLLEASLSIGTVLIDNFDRVDTISKRLTHLSSLLITDKSVEENCMEWNLACLLK